MAYFPATCDYDCKECSQNKCGWCAFHDRPTPFTLRTKEPYNYSTVFTNENTKKED